MQVSRFNNLYKSLCENIGNTTGSVLGASPTSQFSGDTYAPGDTRLPKIIGMGEKKKKKKKFPIIRRNFPGGM